MRSLAHALLTTTFSDRSLHLYCFFCSRSHSASVKFEHCFAFFSRFPPRIFPPCIFCPLRERFYNYIITLYHVTRCVSQQRLHLRSPNFKLITMLLARRARLVIFTLSRATISSSLVFFFSSFRPVFSLFTRSFSRSVSLHYILR